MKDIYLRRLTIELGEKEDLSRLSEISENFRRNHDINEGKILELFPMREMKDLVSRPCFQD